MKKSVLIVDDDKTNRESIAKVLTNNYIIYTASNGQKAMDILNKNEDIDLVLTDMMMPEMDGIELLEKIRSTNNDLAVILITGHSSIESAVDAMRKGAYDYITKPIDLNKFEITIKNALENKRLKSENILLRQKFKEKFDATTLVGDSKKINEIMELVKRVSSTKATVLIQGESGTGKELVANIIHYNSPVADGPFIKVNCSVFAEGVLESELFGHEKGAFTGALYTRKGRFELAEGGTILLDEVGDMPLSIQIKILRVLQEHEFERVGGTKTIKTNARIISTTNKKLEDLVKVEKFREDLLYRLRVVTIDVPTLMERKEDIPLLAEYFLKKFTEVHNKKIKGISPEVMEIINSYNWPGNIRELINCVESSVVMARGDFITPESLPPYLFYKQNEEDIRKSGESLYEIERQTILNALSRVRGKKTEAAKLLGIGLRTLYRKLDEYSIKNY
ncbi:MAG: sigma-54 dependent transcriptional regulator [Nitrospirota bacterium]